mmetsp:Transcript_142928/g.252361  ORF Transcript_142928/g.252361 Transcript_142928/m.252361 type:complete len:84 (-) Transcript_142928:447-698(-)
MQRLQPPFEAVARRPLLAADDAAACADGIVQQCAGNTEGRWQHRGLRSVCYKGTCLAHKQGGIAGALQLVRAGRGLVDEQSQL